MNVISSDVSETVRDEVDTSRKKYSSKEEELVAVEVFLDKVEAAVHVSGGCVHLATGGNIENRPVFIISKTKQISKPMLRADSLMNSHLPLRTWEEFFRNEPRFVLEKKKGHLWLSSAVQASSLSASSATKAAPAANASKKYVSEEDELVAVWAFVDKMEAAIRASPGGSITIKAVKKMTPMPVHIKVNSLKHTKCVEVSHLSPKFLNEFLSGEPRFVFEKGVVRLQANDNEQKERAAVKTFLSEVEELAALEVFLDKVEAAMRASKAGCVPLATVGAIENRPVFIISKKNVAHGVSHEVAPSAEDVGRVL
jgi:hypothetical protein